MFRHADVVCLCLVCILSQSSMLHDFHMEEAYSRVGLMTAL